jgi:hypothetical protein
MAKTDTSDMQASFERPLEAAPVWATPPFVLSATLLYLVVHFAIRMAMGQSLSVDDADQALFTQFYAWAYRYKAPPLFIWMLTTIGFLIPVGALPIALLRYALLGITYGFSYLTARRLIADPRLSAASVYSFAAINTFAEASHRNLVNTTALAAILALAWYLLVRLAETPRLAFYLALGAVCALGMLAKWNFAIFILALPLAALLHRETRPLILDWRIVPAALLCAAIVLPTVIATVRMGSLGGEDVGSLLHTGEGRGLAQIVEGTWKLVDTTIIYSLPLLPIVLIVFGVPIWRGLRVDGGPATSRPLSAAFVGTTIAVGLALFLGLVLFLGATEFKVRYFYPVLLILPVWLFMLVERGRPAGRTIGLFVLVMLALAVGVTGKRIATQLTGHLSCGLCLELRPYPQLAAALREAGYRDDGTIVAGGDMAGNLRVVFPKSRIVDLAYVKPPPRSEAGPCLVVWQAHGDPGTTSTDFVSRIVTEMRGDPEAPHKEGRVTAPMLAPLEGEFSIGYRLYTGPNGDCR